MVMYPPWGLQPLWSDLRSPYGLAGAPTLGEFSAPKGGTMPNRRVTGDDAETDDAPNTRPLETGTFGERLARIEERFYGFTKESRADRTSLKDGLGKLEVQITNLNMSLSAQIAEKAKQIAYIDVLKWGAALIIVAVAGYFFHALTEHVDRNTTEIQQRLAPGHP
jgi:hypothetical protein